MQIHREATRTAASWGRACCVEYPRKFCNLQQTYTLPEAEGFFQQSMCISSNYLLTLGVFHVGWWWRCSVGLDLEIAGAVRDLAEGEVGERPGVKLKRLRDSHHAVARMYVQGLTDAQISLQTGYALSRLSALKHDPSFIELLVAYRQDARAVSQSIEDKMLMMFGDFLQATHEDLLDDEEIPFVQKLEAVKLLADRTGFSPVTRSVNKNVNVNIGERLDAARKRKEIEG